MSFYHYLSCYRKTGGQTNKAGIENLLLERTEKPQETSEDYKGR